MKVLLADDSKTMRMLIRHLLEELGIKDVTEVEDGVAAVTSTTQHYYDLIITDIHMPKMTGIELVEAIRSGGVESPIVVITSDSDYRSVAKMQELGANAYLTKPFTRRKLQSVIQQLGETT